MPRPTLDLRKTDFKYCWTEKSLTIGTKNNGRARNGDIYLHLLLNWEGRWQSDRGGGNLFDQSLILREESRFDLLDGSFYLSMDHPIGKKKENDPNEMS